jgi:hypothetical protein
MINNTNGIGRITVETMNLPNYVKRASGTYTFSGKVLVDYHHDDDPPTKDYIHIAAMNDDGNGFKDIFAGVIPVHQKANGVRYMPFPDNKRVLLGDYVLECSPDIDNCEKAELVPVEYPWQMHENPQVFMSWSEVIISQDNEHVCWTTLLSGMTAAVVGIGQLKREANGYAVTHAQIISNHSMLAQDPQREGYHIVLPSRGGEVKQFVRGGTAISLAGGGDSALTDSIVQDLLSPELTQITRVPGYEETTIFSPDEKLGLVMSTRGSEKTSCAILGLLPRPHARLVTSSIINCVYLFAVAGVRSYRMGNVGPALIEIEKSMADSSYIGAVLNDPEGQWVYCSPMSWHPDGKRVMWPEVLRGSSDRRLRMATLLDYEPSTPVGTHKTPENIAYGTDDIAAFQLPKEPLEQVKIAGKASGLLVHTRKAHCARNEYMQLSDDGVTFFKGFEEVRRSEGEAVYEAQIEMTGAKTGSMHCRIAFSEVSFTSPTRILSEKSDGYAEYNGVRLDVDDMAD